MKDLITRIEGDMAHGRFTPGEFMGTRSELCVAYGVTGPIFFQATRVLADRGLVELRQGNRGGLFAADRSIARYGKRMATYLECIGIDYEDAAAVSRALQELCIRFGTGALTLAEADAIRATGAELAEVEPFEGYHLMSRIFQQIAEGSGNVVLALLYRAITDIMLDNAVWEAGADRSVPHVVLVDLCLELADAVIGGDHEAALVLFRHFRDNITRKQAIERSRGGGEKLQVTATKARPGRNLPERLAAQILADLRAINWPVGEKLGAEPELIARYAVSRATFRQAIRLLEEYSAVETRRGPKGGLIISSPDPSVVNSTALDMLLAAGASAADAEAVLMPLLHLALETCWAKGPEARGALARSCRTAAKNPESAQAGAAAVISTLLSSNGKQVLTLFTSLVATLYGRLEAARPERADDAVRVLEAVAQAAEAGDQAKVRCGLAELLRTTSLRGFGGVSA